MMLSLSTSFCSERRPSADDFIKTLENLDIAGVELEYRMPADLFQQIQAPLIRSRLQVTSIHNFFPAPPDKSGLSPGGDIFPLSHPDKEVRGHAIQWTARTIEHANRMEAERVVLHCGYVDMIHASERLVEFYRDGRIESDEAREFVTKKTETRERLKEAHLDALMFSLDRLISLADKHGVVLGLENRYHYHELPGFHEFEILFNEFSGAPIGYWHDCGHAHTLEQLGIIAPGALLDTYGHHLAGIHIHDANGLDDHLPPGDGTMDYDRLKPFLKKDIPLVIELKPGTPHHEIARGINFVRQQRFGE